MKDYFYLIISESGAKGVRKSKPSLAFNEIAIKMSLEIPDILFRKPLLEATITIDKEKVQPENIFPDIIINTKELIEQQTGAKIDFRVVEYPKEDDKREETD